MYMKDTLYTIDSFKISNYRSFYDRQSIVFDSNITAFYGANASGKSNIFKALSLFQNFVVNSTQPNFTDSPYDPFLLSPDGVKKPLHLEVTFSDKRSDLAYRYMFESDGTSITEEAMYDLSSSRERTLFLRSKGYTATAGKNSFGKTIFEQTRPNSLIITQAQVFNNKYAAALFEMIENLGLVEVGNAPHLRDFGMQIVQKNPELKTRALKLLKGADFMIRDFNFVSGDIPSEVIDTAPFSDEIKAQLRGQKVSAVQTLHAIRNTAGEIIDNVLFDMSNQESRGTNIFFDLAIPILDCVENGKTMYIDEFSSSLHSDICKFIVNLFRDSKTGAKLIVNTHDQSLMKNGRQGLLDRDNIIIVEKDKFERTHVTPLTEKRSIRKDDNIEKKYRYGLYGGRPFIKVQDD